MSLRMPQNLSTSPRFDTGLSVLEAELLGERAAVLGRLGREVETTLAALAAADSGDASRRDLRASASDAVWRFFIQREVCGMLDHAQAIAHYSIPAEVLAGVGAMTVHPQP